MKNIERLCEKAELSRHFHGELERKRRKQGRILYAAVQIIMLIVAVVAAIYFRVTARESSEISMLREALLWIVMIFPAIGTALIILDATVFRLRDGEEQHKKGVELWGNWIRKAKEFRVQGGENKTAKKIERRYRKCMRETSNTSSSSKQFIKYKRDWIEKKNQSIELDKEKKWKVYELQGKEKDVLRRAENE